MKALTRGYTHLGIMLWISGGLANQRGDRLDAELDAELDAKVDRFREEGESYQH